MYKYEMDPASILEDTERTRLCPQTYRRTERQSGTSITPPPFQLRCNGGYNCVYDRWNINIHIWLTALPCFHFHPSILKHMRLHSWNLGMDNWFQHIFWNWLNYLSMQWGPGIRIFPENCIRIIVVSPSFIVSKSDNSLDIVAVKWGLCPVTTVP